jgi:hypothetical protein
MVHHCFVDFDDLIDDALVCFGDAGKIRDALRLEKAVDDALAVLRRQVDRQAFRAERLA